MTAFKSLTITTLMLLAGNSIARSEVIHVAPAPLKNVAATKQHRTINAAASVAKAGDTVQIHTGVYRETVFIKNNGTAQQPIRFEAAPAAHVVVTGADRLLDWTKEGEQNENIFSSPWPHRFATSTGDLTRLNDDYHRLLGRGEQVFVDEYPMRQVLSREQLSRGTFWADLDNKRLYVWPSNNARLGPSVEGDPPVEASTRSLLWEVSGDYVTTKGIRFRYAANLGQIAAAQFKGRNAVVEDCIFELTNSVGASFLGTDASIRRTTFQDNGQLGWSAFKAHNLYMTDSLTRNNNTKNFKRNWEAGGNKIVLTRGTVIEKSRFEDNRGDGLWFDIGNEKSTVRNCLFKNNEEAGLYYEISYGLHAHDNVFVRNGIFSYGGAYGTCGGISIGSSPNAVIERNLLIGNREGFQFVEHLRSSPQIDDPKGTPEHPIWNHSHVVRNNVFAYNRDAQVWAWFETGDARYWPTNMQAAMYDNRKPPASSVAGYEAKTRKGVPADLSLEKLNFQFSNNLLTPGDNGGTWNWGLPWFGKIRRYTSLDEMRNELKIDKGSVVAPFIFADYNTLDLRVPADSPALKMQAYPKGEVPGVKLGILP